MQLIAGLKKEYEDGATLRTLAKKYHRHTDTIRAMLVFQGVAIRTSEKEFPDEDLRRQYEEGASLEELAAKYECEPQTVASHIKKNGGKIRTATESRKLRGRQSTPLTPELIADIKAKYPMPGWSIPRLAKETGVFQKEIRKLIVDDPNIELRSPGGLRKNDRQAGGSKGR